MGGPLLVAHALTNPNSLVPFFVFFFFSIISSWLYISYSKTKHRETIIDTPASYIYNINIRGVSIFLLPILFFYDNILIIFDDVIFDTDKCFPFSFSLFFYLFYLPSFYSKSIFISHPEISQTALSRIMAEYRERASKDFENKKEEHIERDDLHRVANDS